jgi:Double-GTPase 2
VAVLYVLVFIVIAALYLGYLALAVPIAAIFAFVVYGLGMPTAYFVGLWRVLVIRPPWLSSPKRLPKIPAGADPATLEYFYGPALTDADHAMRVAYGNCHSLWQRGARAVVSSFGRQEVILTGPLGVGGAVGMAAGTAVGTVAAAGCALVHLLAVGISAASVRAAGTVLRFVDSAVLRIKNIRMVCPKCYERVPYPAYECPGRACARRHHDVRPGRFGIVRRRCQCGTRMKTLLLFGSAQMDAYCPHCGTSLEHRPGKAPEIVLPFFGAAGAGKTRLLFSMVAQLRLWSEEAGRRLDGSDHETAAERSGQKQADIKKRADIKRAEVKRAGEERFVAELADTATVGKLENASKWLSPGNATDKTPPELPRAYVVRLTTNHDAWLLHLFDAAGEFFYTPERTQELRYFSQARTFILVIDPLSVESFWDRLLPDQQAELKAVRSAAPAPDLAYQQAHQEIEAMGVQLSKAHLAVVFSRADLIDTPDDDVATWATDELGLGNLVRSARLNFKEACFFHTAAVIADGAMHKSVPELIRWVLARNGVHLPGDLS